MVEEKRLHREIPELSSPLKTDNDDSVQYSGYLSGQYLDNHVNEQRTGFRDINNDEGFEFPGELSLENITSEAVARSRSFLEPYINPIREENTLRIQQYVQTQAPEYRHLLKHYEERVSQIPPGLSDDQLDMRLYEIKRQVEIELRQRGKSIIEETKRVSSVDPASYSDYRKRLAFFLEQWNDYSADELANYIVHRRTVLSLLDESLGIQENGRYSKESAIHQIIYPMRRTSDDISYEQQNLWIIDEKLAFHRFLASDLPFQSYEELEVNSNERPDMLVIFDKAIATVEGEQPFDSIVIFELKRPMRQNYGGNDQNPVDQVLEYVARIRSGRAKDRRGRPIPITNATRYYCYIVCDISPDIEELATNRSFTRTPDGQGYFWYNQNLNSYVEIVSYDKLVTDAKRRNRILFEKLNLPNDL